MSYDIDQGEKPEDKRKGFIGSTVVHIIILIFIIWPWFPEPVALEAEGLMASFGDVQIAGGGSENVTKDPVEEVEEVVEEEVEEVVEEVETIDDNSSPVVVKDDPKPTPTPTPKPKPDPGSLFKGTDSKNDGKGTGSGDGTQGTPDGKGDLGGTGNGDKGKGNGVLGSRQVIKKPDGLAGTWDHGDKIVVYICIDSKGKVIEAKFNRKLSTITDQTLIDAAEACAKEYKYNRAPGLDRSCGDITIKLNLN